ncbi:hypothetical protein C8J56DRAFT_896354 [Mycena floridula]|nr:hypothetical protein C8J56DRAFT_896354 [Mycena floridula]
MRAIKANCKRDGTQTQARKTTSDEIRRQCNPSTHQTEKREKTTVERKTTKIHPVSLYRKSITAVESHSQPLHSQNPEAEISNLTEWQISNQGKISSYSTLNSHSSPRSPESRNTAPRARDGEAGSCRGAGRPRVREGGSSSEEESRGGYRTPAPSARASYAELGIPADAAPDADVGICDPGVIDVKTRVPPTLLFPYTRITRRSAEKPKRPMRMSPSSTSGTPNVRRAMAIRSDSVTRTVWNHYRSRCGAQVLMIDFVGVMTVTKELCGLGERREWRDGWVDGELGDLRELRKI